jgi:hypothetical protein
MLDCVWNVMAHVQKPDFVFRQNRQVHLNPQGRQFSRLLAAEVRVGGSNAGFTMFQGSVKSTGYQFHLPLPLQCVTMCHHISTGLYQYVYSFFITKGMLTSSSHPTMSCHPPSETSVPNNRLKLNIMPPRQFNTTSHKTKHEGHANFHILTDSLP